MVQIYFLEYLNIQKSKAVTRQEEFRENRQKQCKKIFVVLSSTLD